MSATSTAKHEEGLARAVRDHLRLELIALGHMATGGDVHVSDHAVASHVGMPSNFNRATCLSLEQPDVAFGEIEAFFAGLAHTLWIDADGVDADADAMIRAHGYIPMPAPRGVACTRLPESVDREPGNRAELLSDPRYAPEIADVVASGFGSGPEDRMVAEDLARAILRHARPWDHGAVYGIRHEGGLVSVVALLCTRDVAGVAGVFTVPGHRDHHHASTLLQRALHDAYALGYRIAVTLATPDSEHTLAQLGFGRVADFRVYRQRDASGSAPA